jgi:hypothetical protein
MLGDSLGDAPPVVQDGDSIAFVNFIPNDQIESYAGQDIRTQFSIGPDLIDQVMSIPLPPSPPPPNSPPLPPGEIGMRIEATSGASVETNSYLYVETSVEGMYIYTMVNFGLTSTVFFTQYDMGYDPVTKIWSAVGPSAPVKWGTDGTGTDMTVLPTDSNVGNIQFGDYWGDETFSFRNPYYLPDGV